MGILAPMFRRKRKPSPVGARFYLPRSDAPASPAFGDSWDAAPDRGRVSDRETDDVTRRVADCLERHLESFGFEPYRYPSGENKSVELRGVGEVRLHDAEGRSWLLRLTPAP